MVALCTQSLGPVSYTHLDTVFSSSFEKVDDYTVLGYRLTNGWAPEQHVYFYTTFSSPIKECRLFLDNECVEETSALKGRNVKAILTFENPEKILDVKTGISAVDMKGAEDNHRKMCIRDRGISLKAIMYWEEKRYPV